LIISSILFVVALLSSLILLLFAQRPLEGALTESHEFSEHSETRHLLPATFVDLGRLTIAFLFILFGIVGASVASFLMPSVSIREHQLGKRSF